MVSEVETGLISALINLLVHYLLGNSLLLEVLLEIIMVLVQGLLSLSVRVDDATVLWDCAGGKLLQNSV